MPTANKLKADDIENQAYLEDVLDEAKDNDTSIVIAWVQILLERYAYSEIGGTFILI